MPKIYAPQLIGKYGSPMEHLGSTSPTLPSERLQKALAFKLISQSLGSLDIGDPGGWAMSVPRGSLESVPSPPDPKAHKGWCI